MPVTRYGLTGTPDFGESVLEVLTPETAAVILKNHGLIAFGDDFSSALGNAESSKKRPGSTSTRLSANGGREPDLVPEALIPEMIARFRESYGHHESRNRTRHIY